MVDSAVFFVLIVVTVALYVVVQNWGPTRILFHASLLASVAFFLLCVVSVLEYWYSLKTHLVIVWLKSVNLLLALVVVCSVVVPIMTTRAVEVLPTMVHSLFFECTCAACVVLPDARVTLRAGEVLRVPAHVEHAVEGADERGFKLLQLSAQQ